MADANLNIKMKVFSALCIIFVVFKHVGHDIVHEPLTYTPVWRMPAFIFISGYFFRSKHCMEFFEYVGNNIKKLLVPLYGWSIFYGILVYILTKHEYIHFGATISFKNLIIDTFTHTHQYEFNSAMWFLSVLFIVKVLYCGIRCVIKESIYNEILITILLIGLNFLSVNYSLLNIQGQQLKSLFALPFIKSAFFLVFFHLGFLYKKYLESRDSFSVVRIVLAFFVNLCIVAFYCGDTQDISKLDLFYFDSSWMNFYNNEIWVPFITSVIGIYIWMNIAELMSNHISSNDILIKIGNASFAIMIHHIFCFWLFNSAIYFTTKIYGHNIFSFNKDIYMNDVWYKVTDCWPLINFAYLFVGIFGSMCIDKLYKFLKRRVNACF